MNDWFNELMNEWINRLIDKAIHYSIKDEK